MLLLGIYLVSFIMIWCAYLHKLPPIGVYAQQSKSSILYTIIKIVYNVLNTLWFESISLCVKQKLYDISCNFIMCSYDFIMCEIRDLALFLVKICQIIQKYPPLWRKDFFQKTFPYFVYNTQKYLQWDFFRPTPYYLVPQFSTIIL